jgi:hypothetical protein
MPIKRFAFALSLLICLTAILIPARAQTKQPAVYFFGASECDYCANGLSFLTQWKKSDDRFSLRVFDIVASSDDAGAFVQIVQAIGLADPRVPMTVVGNHVFIGYEGDATTGVDIKAAVEQCRASSCPDVIRGILTLGADIAMARAGWDINRRFAKAAMNK